LDDANNVYLTGWFQQSCQFGGTTLYCNGLDDIFIARLGAISNDLAAVSISGNTTPTAGILSPYVVTISNNGISSQSNYTVKLMLEGDVELDSMSGTLIEPQQTLNFTLNWSPAAAGPTFIYGKVVLDGDENPANNQTPILNLNVQAPGTIFAVVSDMQNSPIGGASINCSDICGPTDALGGCFLLVAAGIHDVTASHPDYISVTQNNIAVTSGQMVMVSFQLAPTSDYEYVTPVTTTALLGNYPNPFGSVTTIQYSLKEHGPISISIYNLKGELVRSLLRTTKNSGQHSVVWDGTDDFGRKPANGIYYCVLNSGTSRSIMKLLLLK
jgi:hypothetical protein